MADMDDQELSASVATKRDGRDAERDDLARSDEQPWIAHPAFSDRTRLVYTRDLRL